METLALVIGGFVAPFLTNWLKSLTGWHKQAALLLTMAVSVIIALIASLLSGQGINWQDMTTVFAVATAVYHLFMKG